MDFDDIPIFVIQQKILRMIMHFDGREERFDS